MVNEFVDIAEHMYYIGDVNIVHDSFPFGAGNHRIRTLSRPSDQICFLLSFDFDHIVSPFMLWLAVRGVQFAAAVYPSTIESLLMPPPMRNQMPAANHNAR